MLYKNVFNISNKNIVVKMEKDCYILICIQIIRLYNKNINQVYALNIFNLRFFHWKISVYVSW